MISLFFNNTTYLSHSWESHKLKQLKIIFAFNLSSLLIEISDFLAYGLLSLKYICDWKENLCFIFLFMCCISFSTRDIIYMKISA